MKPSIFFIPRRALVVNDDTHLRSLSPDPTLRNYAQDAAQQNVSEVAEFFAPTVEVATIHGRYKQYSAEYRFKLAETLRDPNMGGVTRIGFSASDARYTLESHALDFPIADYQNVEDLRDLEREGADLLSTQAHLKHEVETINFALSKVGGGTTQNFKDNGFDVIDFFDKQILAVKLLAKNGAGVRISMGTTAWRIIKNHEFVRLRFGGGRTKDAVPTLEEFAKMLILPVEIKVSDIVVDTAKPGKSEATSFAMTNQIIFFPAAARPNRMDSSWLKTFRLRNRWMVPGRYITPDDRDAVLKFDWNKLLIETNANSAIRINATES